MKINGGESLGLVKLDVCTCCCTVSHVHSMGVYNKLSLTHYNVYLYMLGCSKYAWFDTALYVTQQSSQGKQKGLFHNDLYNSVCDNYNLASFVLNHVILAYSTMDSFPACKTTTCIAVDRIKAGSIVFTWVTGTLVLVNI